MNIRLDECLIAFDKEHAKHPQYASFRKNAKLMLCKKNYGAKGVNWVKKGQYYLVYRMTKGHKFVKKQFVDCVYLTVFSDHIWFHDHIVGMCEVPTDRFELPKEYLDVMNLFWDKQQLKRS